jgi:hypothetical protein
MIEREQILDTTSNRICFLCSGPFGAQSFMMFTKLREDFPPCRIYTNKLRYFTHSKGFRSCLSRHSTNSGTLGHQSLYVMWMLRAPGNALRTIGSWRCVSNNRFMIGRLFLLRILQGAFTYEKQWSRPSTISRNADQVNYFLSPVHHHRTTEYSIAMCQAEIPPGQKICFGIDEIAARLWREKFNVACYLVANKRSTVRRAYR